MACSTTCRQPERNEQAIATDNCATNHRGGRRMAHAMILLRRRAAPRTGEHRTRRARACAACERRNLLLQIGLPYRSSATSTSGTPHVEERRTGRKPQEPAGNCFLQ
eukprot:9201453-Alexandrium_andersonii.AAC.1